MEHEKWKKTQMMSLARGRELRIVMVLFVLMISLQVVTIKMTSASRTVITPVWIHQPLWVSGTRVSAAYLEEMTRYCLALRFDVNPATVQAQHQALLRYVSPREQVWVSKVLHDDAQVITKNVISRVFYPTQMQLNERELRVDVEGDVTLIMNDRQQVHHAAHVELAFEQTPLGIRLMRMREVDVKVPR